MAYIGKNPTSVPLTSSDIEDGIISLPKLTDGTDGNIISYDASGNPVAVATGTDGQVLTSTGAGSPPVFETPASATNTPAFLARLSSDQSVSNGTITKVLLDGTVYDTASAFASNKFTVPSGQDGTYVLYFSVVINAAAVSVVQYVQAMIYKNGTGLTDASGLDFRNNYGGYANQVTCTIAVPLVAGDYIELYMDQAQISGTPTIKATNSGKSRTYLGGYKLIT